MAFVVYCSMAVILTVAAGVIMGYQMFFVKPLVLTGEAPVLDGRHGIWGSKRQVIQPMTHDATSRQGEAEFVSYYVETKQAI